MSTFRLPPQRASSSPGFLTTAWIEQPPAKVVLGKGSGIDSIKAALKDIGVQATDEEAMQVVAGVKEFSLEHKRLLTDAEFRSVVAKALPNKTLPNKAGHQAVPLLT
jgi:isopropylmalate/homocitrate/citramalate synthase